jgi:hypothetical protein
MTRPDPSIVPPGGFFFIERAGLTLTAPTFELLVSKLTDHRVTNRLPLGDPETEVAEAILRRNPHISTVHRSRTANPSGSTTSGRVLAWTLDTANRLAVSDSRVFASAKLAASRASVCAECPFRQPPSPDPSLLDQQVSQVRTMVTRSVDHHDLGYCTFFHHDNAFACLIESIQPELNPPEQCWMSQNSPTSPSKQTD